MVLVGGLLRWGRLGVGGEPIFELPFTVVAVVRLTMFPPASINHPSQHQALETVIRSVRSGVFAKLVRLSTFKVNLCL